ncbi:MAG: thioredoxin-dependent thiol peroxidase [Rhodospirillaceae bacterium]
MATKRNAKAKPKAAKKKAVKKAAVKRKASASPKASAAKATKKTAAFPSLAGKVAPAFSLMTDAGEKVSLKDFRGRRVILYFYPKDDTPGCTTQACAFRDAEVDFSRADAVVLGVSKDSVKSHQKFKSKYTLNFPLLADDAGVCEAYGVWKQKNMYGRTYMGIERSTFLIDQDGKVRAEWRKVSVPGHAAEVIKALQSL